jgi:hypothetical protein
MHKKSFIIFVAVCTAILSLLLSGCGAAAIARPTPDPGAQLVKITGSCDITVNGNVITVSGTTNIMDGAMIYISVLGQNGMTLDKATIKKSGDQISQNFTMDDKYEKINAITGFITCAPRLYGTQDDLYKTYGNKFENIDAPNDNYQWDNEGKVIIFQSKQLIIHGELQ